MVAGRPENISEMHINYTYSRLYHGGVETGTWVRLGCMKRFTWGFDSTWIMRSTIFFSLSIGGQEGGESPRRTHRDGPCSMIDSEC